MPRNGKIQSINIENINDETTPERPVNRFVPIMWGSSKNKQPSKFEQEKQPYRLRYNT